MLIAAACADRSTESTKPRAVQGAGRANLSAPSAGPFRRYRARDVGGRNCRATLASPAAARAPRAGPGRGPDHDQDDASRGRDAQIGRPKSDWCLWPKKRVFVIAINIAHATELLRVAIVVESIPHVRLSRSTIAPLNSAPLGGAFFTYHAGRGRSRIRGVLVAWRVRRHR